MFGGVSVFSTILLSTISQSIETMLEEESEVTGKNLDSMVESLIRNCQEPGSSDEEIMEVTNSALEEVSNHLTEVSRVRLRHLLLVGLVAPIVLGALVVGFLEGWNF